MRFAPLLHGTLGALFVFLMALPVTVPAAEVKAKVLLADQREPWDIVFTGRGSTKWIRLTKVDGDVDMRFPPESFRKVEFAVDLKDTQLEERYAAEQYAEVVAILQPKIQDAAEYLDLPNNLVPLFRLMLRAQYWSGDYNGAGRTATQLFDILKEGDPARREARIIQGLSLLMTDNHEPAKTLLETLEVGGKSEPEDAWYWYAMGHLHTHLNQLDAAQEAFARVLGFHTKSFEWMPAGLYAAAEGYIDAHGYDSARQVIENIRIAYPQSQWGQKLPDLLDRLETHEAAWKEEVARREAEAKRQAELAALPFRERLKKDPDLRRGPTKASTDSTP